jgi:hypothetical protein
MDLVLGRDGVDRLDPLQGIEINLRFELGTVLTSFLDMDRFFLVWI